MVLDSWNIKRRKAQAQHQQYKSKPKPKKCFECGQEGYFAHECETPPPQPLPMHARPFAYDAYFIIRKNTKGKAEAMFLGPPNKNRPN